jgi:hypothetical protein
MRINRYLKITKGRDKKNVGSQKIRHRGLPNEMEASRQSAQRQNTKSLSFVQTERK